ncbi:hypothetical protein ACFOPN_12860 [Xanthomonas hyacinthi]|uniref:hypothetical protein n=1 Tax=Xanthomonas hyacinthi TaxID=56455 RepID=UPI0013036EE2|nr:hypothetical protein [Xanthomonas hyacinthi]
MQLPTTNAWSTSPVAAGGLFHSDRGSQYASDNFPATPIRQVRHDRLIRPR